MKRNRTFWAIIVAIVLTLGLSVFALLEVINMDADVRIPASRMPSPNAYDSYVAAGKAIVDNESIMNAFYASERQFSLASVQLLLRKNARALALLRQGSRYNYLHPAVRAANESDIWEPQITFRDLARLLVLQARVRAARGDWSVAAESSLEALRFGQEIPHGGGIREALKGMVIQSVARTDFWHYVDHLSVAEARRAVREMEQISAGSVPLADIIEEEKWHGVSSLTDMFAQEHWRNSLAETAETQRTIFGAMAQPGRELDSPFFKLRAFTCSKRGSIRTYIRYMDTVIANARLPYASMKSAPPTPNNPIALVMASPEVFDKVAFADARNQTQNKLLTVKLAVRAYFADHRHYPADTTALIPTYLKGLPDDPFALNAPVRYKLVGNKPIVYSVGPDGRDDGGRRIWDSKAKPGWEAIVDGDCKGDVVAGINVH